MLWVEAGLEVTVTLATLNSNLRILQRLPLKSIVGQVVKKWVNLPTYYSIDTQLMCVCHTEFPSK